MRRFDRVLLIVNPVARTVSRPTMAVIEKALSADFKLEVLETAERGHATEVAAQAALDGLDLVVVFSGDGTINEVVNGLAGTDAVLGVIPGGATNILAQALGMPLDPVEATGVLIARALDGQARLTEETSPRQAADQILARLGVRPPDQTAAARTAK